MKGVERIIFDAITRAIGINAGGNGRKCPHENRYELGCEDCNLFDKNDGRVVEWWGDALHTEPDDYAYCYYKQAVLREFGRET